MLQWIAENWQWFVGVVVLGVILIVIQIIQTRYQGRQLKLQARKDDRDKAEHDSEHGPDILIGMSNGHLDGLLNLGPQFLNRGSSKAIIDKFSLDAHDLSRQVSGMNVNPRQEYEEKARWTGHGKRLTDLYGKDLLQELVNLIEPIGSFQVKIVYLAPRIKQRVTLIQEIRRDPETRRWHRVGEPQVTETEDLEQNEP